MLAVRHRHFLLGFPIAHVERVGDHAGAGLQILQQLGARAIVVGHTPVLPGRIAPRFGGRVIQIDAGMLDGEFYPKGVPVALELRGETATAIYLDRREPLALPAVK